MYELKKESCHVFYCMTCEYEYKHNHECYNQERILLMK